MPRLKTLALFGLVFVAACQELEGFGQTEDAPKYPPLPEEVLAIADPRQNLTAATILPEDNCYWYEHVNVVETTFLPLRSTDGRHICIRQEEAEVAEAAS